MYVFSKNMGDEGGRDWLRKDESDGSVVCEGLRYWVAEGVETEEIGTGWPPGATGGLGRPGEPGIISNNCRDDIESDAERMNQFGIYLVHLLWFSCCCAPPQLPSVSFVHLDSFPDRHL